MLIYEDTNTLHRAYNQTTFSREIEGRIESEGGRKERVCEGKGRRGCESEEVQRVGYGDDIRNREGWKVCVWMFTS